MLRITRSVSTDAVVVHLQGKLLSAWVGEVLTALAAARADGAVRVNLTELSFADAAGIDLLRALRTDGVEFMGASAFITGLMTLPA